jgi:hypothetical protein
MYGSEKGGEKDDCSWNRLGGWMGQARPSPRNKRSSDLGDAGHDHVTMLKFIVIVIVMLSNLFIYIYIYLYNDDMTMILVIQIFPWQLHQFTNPLSSYLYLAFIVISSQNNLNR